jgi:hypothetical protein
VNVERLLSWLATLSKLFNVIVTFVATSLILQGYTDEPISKILSNISGSETVLLDRWCLEVEKNPNAEANENGKDNLPLNVVNNYYSLGVDAHIALEFHEARGWSLFNNERTICSSVFELQKLILKNSTLD